MKASVKYFLVYVELVAIVSSVILGAGAAESLKWTQAWMLLFGPFIYSYIVGLGRHIHFVEVYERAKNIRLVQKNGFDSTK